MAVLVAAVHWPEEPRCGASSVADVSGEAADRDDTSLWDDFEDSEMGGPEP